MREIVLLTIARSVIGGVALLLGPLVTAIWTLTGEVAFGPLMRRAKKSWRAEVGDRAQLDAVQDAAYYLKMLSAGNMGALLSIIGVVPVLRWDLRHEASQKLDYASLVIAGVVLIPLIVMDWTLAFPLVTGTYLALKSRYEWGSGGVLDLVLTPVLKAIGSAMLSASLSSDLFPPAFFAECLVVTVAMQVGYNPTARERFRNYVGLIPALPLILLDWRI